MQDCLVGDQVKNERHENLTLLVTKSSQLCFGRGCSWDIKRILGQMDGHRNSLYPIDVLESKYFFFLVFTSFLVTLINGLRMMAF